MPELQYDKQNRLVDDGVQKYFWEENDLVRVERNRRVIKYFYAQGRLMGRESNGVRETFKYSYAGPATAHFKIEVNGQVKETYTFFRERLRTVQINNQTLKVVCSDEGTVQSLLNAQDEVVQGYLYNHNGVVAHVYGLNPSPPSSRFLLQSQFYDHETGLVCVHLRDWFNPRLGIVLPEGMVLSGFSDPLCGALAENGAEPEEPSWDEEALRLVLKEGDERRAARQAFIDKEHGPIALWVRYEGVFDEVGEALKKDAAGLTVGLIRADQRISEVGFFRFGGEVWDNITALGILMESPPMKLIQADMAETETEHDRLMVEGYLGYLADASVVLLPAGRTRRIVRIPRLPRNMGRVLPRRTARIKPSQYPYAPGQKFDVVPDGPVPAGWPNRKAYAATLRYVQKNFEAPGSFKGTGIYRRIREARGKFNNFRDYPDGTLKHNVAVMLGELDGKVVSPQIAASGMQGTAMPTGWIRTLGPAFARLPWLKQVCNWCHTEFKMLDPIFRSGRRGLRGTLVIFTERYPCKGCFSSIQKFREQFPDVNIITVSNRGVK